jgi:hypothetical protein
MRDYIFMVLAIIALIVVILTCNAHLLRDPRHAGIAENEDMQRGALGKGVGDSNLYNEPNSRASLANVPWRYALGMAPLRSTTRQGHLKGIRNNSKDTFTPMEVASLALQTVQTVGSL